MNTDAGRQNRLKSVRDHIYEMLAKEFGEQCAICGLTPDVIFKRRWPSSNGHPALYVDHCHRTGKPRGLLCNNCNQSIGKFQDSIELLTKAIKYLQAHL